MFPFFSPKNGICSWKSTHNMLSHRGSVVCRPFWICCYNSGQAGGVMEPKWRCFFSCLSVNTLGGMLVLVRRQAADGDVRGQNV